MNNHEILVGCRQHIALEEIATHTRDVSHNYGESSHERLLEACQQGSPALQRCYSHEFWRKYRHYPNCFALKPSLVSPKRVVGCGVGVGMLSGAGDSFTSN